MRRNSDLQRLSRGEGLLATQACPSSGTRALVHWGVLFAASEGAEDGFHG